MVELADILSKAEHLKKRDYSVYNSLKQEISKMNLPADSYEYAIMKLSEILEV